MQEDSNGDFEFVEKNNRKKSSISDSLSSISSLESMLPSASTPSTGNILSNVAPPSALPSFISVSDESLSRASTNVTTKSTESSSAYHQNTFSPAIPPSKGDPSSTNRGIPIAEPVGIDMGGSILGWMKGAVGSSTGILSKVAEKARNSVDSMITTLDPQMREFIYSGGDIEIIVASDKEIKISPIREAFQATFGKATISGIHAEAKNVAAQPVGYESALKAAEERIASIRKASKVFENCPVVVIENFLLEIVPDKWFDLGLILLDDPIRKIQLHTYTQMTPVPGAIVAVAREETPTDYPLKATGFKIPIGGLIASNFQVAHTEWHQAMCGVSRREMLLMAAKSLSGLYKNTIGSH